MVYIYTYSWLMFVFDTSMTNPRFLCGQEVVIWKAKPAVQRGSGNHGNPEIFDHTFHVILVVV